MLLLTNERLLIICPQEYLSTPELDLFGYSRFVPMKILISLLPIPKEKIPYVKNEIFSPYLRIHTVLFVYGFCIVHL